MKSLFKLLLVTLFLINSYVFCEEIEKSQQEKLEEEVNRLLQINNVDRRVEVGKIFELGDIYLSNEEKKKAMKMYHEGLMVDSFRFEYQLKHAKLLFEAGQKEEAIEKVKTTYKYAEKEEIIQEAYNLLKEYGITDELKQAKKSFPKDNKAKIMIVPIGKVNTFLVDEMIQELEEKLGIEYVITEHRMDPGEIDRTAAERVVNDIFEKMKATENPKEFQQLLVMYNIDTAKLKTYAERKKLVSSFFKGITSEEEYLEFEERLAGYEKEGQYNASRLLKNLVWIYYKDKESATTGCLGIAECDIYSGDNNFLFGSGRKGSAVMSYHRFTAAFNERPQNRPILRKRAVKQGISSTFHILGIPRCNSPMCVYAYPHSLEEHDLKEQELCSSCKKNLQEKKSKLSTERVSSKH
jgi:predicted Zn-dependent protease